MSEIWTTTDVTGGRYTISSGSSTVANTTLTYHIGCSDGHVADDEAAEVVDGRYLTKCKDCSASIELPRLAAGFQALRAGDLMARVLCDEDTPEDLALYAELRAALLREKEAVDDALILLECAARALRSRL